MQNSPRLCLLLTGAPGVGKSTIIQRVIESLPARPGGFFTREVRRSGKRVAFEIVTIDGETATLATIDAQPVFARQARLGNYRVNLHGIEAVAVPALTRAQARGTLVIADEIGPMEIFSVLFCQAVQALLDDANCALLGTIVARPYRFADKVKRHPRVQMVRVTIENRAQLAETLISMIQAGK